MYDYRYETFRQDVKTLVGTMHAYRPDAIVAIARGGMMLAQFLGYALEVRNLQCMRVTAYDDQRKLDQLRVEGRCEFAPGQSVLVVDDICDSGDTLRAVLERLQRAHPGVTFRSATLFYKSGAAIRPDFAVREATEWIGFFWDDPLKEG